MTPQSRFLSWPPIRQDARGCYTRFTVLSPAGLRIARAILIDPVKTLWKIIVVLLIIDVLLTRFGLFEIFRSTPLSAQTLTWIAASLFILWTIDRVTRLAVSRFLFGIRFYFHLSPQGIIASSRFRKRHVKRSDPVMFATQPFGPSDCEIYRNSIAIYLIERDERAQKLFEVLDLRAANAITSNLNQALTQATLDHDFDLDPTRHTTHEFN